LGPGCIFFALTGLAFIAAEALVIAESLGAGSSGALTAGMGLRADGRGRSLTAIAACTSVALVFRFKSVSNSLNMRDLQWIDDNSHRFRRKGAQLKLWRVAMVSTGCRGNSSFSVPQVGLEDCWRKLSGDGVDAGGAAAWAGRPGSPRASDSRSCRFIEGASSRGAGTRASSWGEDCAVGVDLDEGEGVGSCTFVQVYDG
jgi:hypothetical protein